MRPASLPDLLHSSLTSGQFQTDLSQYRMSAYLQTCGFVGRVKGTLPHTVQHCRLQVMDLGAPAERLMGSVDSSSGCRASAL